MTMDWCESVCAQVCVFTCVILSDGIQNHPVQLRSLPASKERVIRADDSSSEPPRHPDAENQQAVNMLLSAVKLLLESPRVDNGGTAAFEGQIRQLLLSWLQKTNINDTEQPNKIKNVSSFALDTNTVRPLEGAVITTSYCIYCSGR